MKVPILMCSPSVRNTLRLLPSGEPTRMGTSPTTYFTLLCRCTVILHLLPATATCAIMLSQNHFPAYFGFSSSNFTVQDHIPTTCWRCSNDHLLQYIFHPATSNAFLRGHNIINHLIGCCWILGKTLVMDVAPFRMRLQLGSVVFP
jgi:hypothetical protein